jgi:hypothetical protein
MTSPVLTGPPRRGLAWGVAVLIGAAALMCLPDGSDVTAKDEAAPKTTLPADLAMIPGDAFAFATIRVADLWNDEGTKGLREQLAKEYPDKYKEAVKSVGVEPAEIERLTFIITKTPGPRDPGEPPIAILVATTKPYDQKKVLDFLVPDGKKETRKDKTYYVLGEAAVYPIDKSAFLMGRAEVVEDIMDRAGKKGDSALAPALALAAGKHHAVGGMRPAALLEAFGNMIPGEVEGFKPLLEAPAAYGSIDFGKEAKVEARLVTGGEAEAKDAVTAAKGLVALIQTVLPMGEKEIGKMPKGKVDNFKKLYKDFGEALKNVPIEAKGKDVTGALTLKADTATISKAVLEGLIVAKGQAAGVGSANNMKQMVLAMHNYMDAMGAFPTAAIYDKNEKPLLSWRVAILPYIEQEDLYKEFHLDEPWDSAHNKKLLDKMPKIYMVPAQAEKADKEKPTKTHYRVFHGKGAAFEGTTGLKIGDFTDGTSNTIMVVEAEEAVPWTKPDELTFDPKKDPPKVGLKDAEKFNAGFADGSVRTLDKKIDKETLKAYITRNGGEVINE